jgi:hypothetical protein
MMILVVVVPCWDYFEPAVKKVMPAKQGAQSAQQLACEKPADREFETSLQYKMLKKGGLKSPPQ